MARGNTKTTVDDRVWQQLRRKLPGIGRVIVKVGVIGPEAQKPRARRRSGDGEGEGEEEGGEELSNADIMIIHEYGAPKAGIPARRPMRKTFEDKIDELKGYQLKLSKMLLSGKMDVSRAFNILGAWGASAIKATITLGKLTPPLRPATIARKGSSTPLVDTGQLVASITWAVYGAELASTADPNEGT